MTNNIESPDTEQVFAVLAARRIWLPHGKDKAPQGICSDGIVRHLKDWGTTELMTLIEAQELAARVGLSGVGIVIKSSTVIEGRRLIALDVDGIDGYRKADPDKGITAITFDPDTEGENVLARVPMVAELPATYWEASPSCTGGHGLLLASDEWADRFANKGDLHPGGCDHAEFYSGAEPTYITITMRPLQALHIAPLDETGARYLESLGLEPRGAPAAPLPAIAIDGQPLDPARFNLTPEQQKLMAGEPGIDRSAVMHGLLIKIMDAGTSRENLLATLCRTPALWRYCLDHRGNNEAKAIQFAKDEINRAWSKTQAGMRQALTNFNKGWKPALPSETKATPFPGPFPGPMADIVKAALAVARKQQPELTMMAVLSGMAATCGSFFLMPDGCRLNLYFLGIAKTGYGKDMPLRIAKQIARTGNVKILGDLESGQGIEDHVASNTGTLCALDEVAHVLSIMNDPKARSWTRAAARKVLELWSASRDVLETRALARKESTQIQHPAFNLAGFTTPEKLGKAFAPDDFADGLAGRILFVFAETDPPDTKKRQPFKLPENFKTRAMQVAGRLKYILINEGTVISIQAEAEKRLDNLTDEFDKRRRQEGSPWESALCVRSMEKLERIAGVLACWDNPDKPEITLAHVEWAAQFVRASNAAVLKFVGEYLHGGVEQDNAAELMRLMSSGNVKPTRTSEVAAHAAGWIARSALMRAAKKMCKQEYDRALEYLEARGEITLSAFGGIGVIGLGAE